MTLRTWIPGIATAANISCGFASMFLAAQERFDLAVYLLLAAIFLDMLDGLLARMLRATSEFGKQFDSFSDALSFGAAPAFLIQRALLGPLGMLGYAAATVYLLAVVFRLARFNLNSGIDGTKARWTTGMPCPIGASYLMAAVLVRDRLEPYWAAVLILAMVVLLVSRIRLPELRRRSFVSAMLLVGMCNYLAVIFFPGWGTIGWWNLWNGLILVGAWIERRRLTRQPVGG